MCGIYFCQNRSPYLEIREEPLSNVRGLAVDRLGVGLDHKVAVPVVPVRAVHWPGHREHTVPADMYVLVRVAASNSVRYGVRLLSSHLAVRLDHKERLPVRRK